MRKKIIAGNWKMNTTVPEGIQLAESISNSETINGKEIILFAPFTHLSDLKRTLGNNDLVNIGAQNCHENISGAYTGEVSAAMLHSLHVPYVLLGHSERRQYFLESNAQIKTKVNIALSAGLRIVLCCGESNSIRETGKATEWVAQQLTESLLHLPELALEKIVIAYEPIWAIGTGKTATPDQAQEMHQFIRKLVMEKYSIQAANDTSILYGGSVTAQNAKELFSQPDIDGALVGGASLNAESFIQIVKALNS